MWKLGASCCGQNRVDFELFSEYKKAGFEFMEISMGEFNGVDAQRAQGIFDVVKSREINEYVRETGVGIWSFHLPFGLEFSPANSDKKMVKEMIETDERIFELMAQMNVPIAVLHPSTEPICDSEREEQKKRSKENVAILVEKAKSYGIKTALENLPRTCLGRTADEMKELIAIDPSIGICFDVNHLLIESHEKFISALGDRIVTLHISDYDFVDERHLSPGKGDINWQELVSLLDGAGYKGVFMNEVGARKSSQKGEYPTYSELYQANRAILDKYFNKQ